LKIAVLMGGISEEREVSLASGVQVSRALREFGHDVVGVDTGSGVLSEEEESALLGLGVRDPRPHDVEKDLFRTGDLRALTQDPLLSGVELVFPALHGGRGEDGSLQGLLELAGLRYVGSGRVGCALAMDKDLSKRLFRDADVRTPDWIMVRGKEEGEARFGEVIRRLGLPVIVKPPSGGSTLGLSLAHDEGELEGALALSLEYEEEPISRVGKSPSEFWGMRPFPWERSFRHMSFSTTSASTDRAWPGRSSQPTYHLR